MYSDISTPNYPDHFRVAVSRPDLKSLEPVRRLSWAYGAFDDKLAMTSSFGVQSVVMIELLHLAGLASQIPVVTIDIAGPAWGTQRMYRKELQKRYGLKLHVIPAADEDDKVFALERGLTDLGITATLDGIRHTQTDIRANKPFIEEKTDGTITIHPILDWPDKETDDFIQTIPDYLRHPFWEPGARSKGGIYLPPETLKTECGLHLRR